MKVRPKLLLFLVTMLLLSCVKNQEIINRNDDIHPGHFINDWKYEFVLNDPDKNIYRLWIPPGVTPKAIVALSAGGGADGTGLVEDQKWRDFATRENLALLGTHVLSGAEQASTNLLTALKRIGDARGVSYIANLPILLRGHSFGGGFSYEFASLHPKKTLAFCNIKGGNLELKPSNLPPGLLLVGEKDTASRYENNKAVFLAQRAKGDIFCFAVAPGSGHGVDDSDDLVRSFFAAIVKKRLVNSVIQDVDITTIPLGNITTLEAFDYASFPSNKDEASCLINDDFKTTWLNFVK